MTYYNPTNIIVYDLEVFPGFFLAGFEFADGAVYQFEISSRIDDTASLTAFVLNLINNRASLAGFNSKRYDDLILSNFLVDPTPAAAFDLSQRLIHGGLPFYKINNTINSIDTMPLLPGRMSLKRVGVALGHARLQELPVRWDVTPNLAEHDILRSYNRNDLNITRK